MKKVFYISELSVCERLPDVIVLTEIWITENETGFYQVEHYKLITNCNDDKMGKGVAVYCNSKKITIIDVHVLKFNTADVLQIDFEAMNYKFNILSLINEPT